MRKIFIFLFVAMVTLARAQQFADISGSCGDNLPCFTTIQAAIDAAADGETVTVYPGTYTENLTISKGITLISTAGRGSTTIVGTQTAPSPSVEGTIMITGSTNNLSIGTGSNNGFTITGVDWPTNVTDVGAIYIQGPGTQTNLKIAGNDVQANGDGGFISEPGATITGFIFDSNILSGQTYLGAQPNQICCNSACYFDNTSSNVARSLFALNPRADGITAAATNVRFTNNQITGSAGAGGNGNIVVQMAAQNAVVEENVFAASTVSMSATCNRGMLRVRGTGFTIDCNQFNSAGLTGAGAYHILFDKNDSFADGNPVVNSIGNVALNNNYDANPVAYYDPIGAFCPNIQRAVFVNATEANLYNLCGGAVQAVTGTCDKPLPVTLISFSAQGVNNRAVKLSWVTATESNNSHFFVERSKDMKVFETIGKVLATDGQDSQRRDYGYTDEAPISGTSYYRLRQVDRDGKATAYRSVPVVLRADDYGIFPNPVTDQKFTIRLDEPKTAIIRLYNTKGKIVAFQKGASAGDTLVIKTSRQLSAGIYVLTVEERGQIRKHKIVVE